MDRDLSSLLTALKICKSGRLCILIFYSKHRYEIMLDCWKADPELRPSFSFLKHKTEEMIQQANQNYPYLDFNLNDYLPYCNLRLTSEPVSTENILDDYERGDDDNEKESSGSKFGEEKTKEEKENNPSGV